MEKEWIVQGNTALGIEFGSTRIKAVLVGEDFAPLASGGYRWENRLENKVWTYSLEDVRKGLQACFAELCANVREQYGVELKTAGTIGISGMMHGYLAFDENWELLVPFRTWRNTMTAEASEKLSQRFQFPIPQRWSIAHLYQAMLRREEHLPRLAHFTTLAGYVHRLLTGENVLGIGEASGMFPIHSETAYYDSAKLDSFQELIAESGYAWNLKDLLPGVLRAGEPAGVLTETGAKLLDPTGTFQPGVPFCPPEGDAGTGMVATNSVAERTCNVSAGTSIFSMSVLEKPLSKLHPELDISVTPGGKPVAMAHGANGTCDLDAWVSLFGEFATLSGHPVEPDELFGMLYRLALQGDPSCSGMMAYNYISGEHITNVEEGRPLFFRTPESQFTLANFMRTHLSAALSVLRTGMEILFNEENVRLDRITAHGGLFRTPEVGQRLLAAALHTPVTVMETAGEGGPWGMAILASYFRKRNSGESLESFLENRVFSQAKSITLSPDPADESGYDTFFALSKHHLSLFKAF